MTLSARIEEGLKNKPTQLGSLLEEALSRSTNQISASFVNQLDLGPPGLENPVARAGIADANTASEKLTAFQKHYPQGDLVTAPVTNELLFREDKSKPFKKVDASLMEKFEPMGDLIDFVVPDIGAILGEVVTTKGGLSLIKTLGRMFVGGGSGDVAQQSIQEIRGVNEEGGSEIGSRAVGQGVVSATGGAVGFGLGKAVDIARGGGSLSLSPGVDKAMQAGDRLDLPGLTPGQATDIPLITRIESQAGASLPTLQRYFDEQNAAAANVIRKMGDKRQGKGLSESLDQLNNRARGSILSKANSKAFTLSEGGEALQKGIREYDDIARTTIRESYKKAQAQGRPEFNLSEVREVAEDLSQGVRGVAKDGSEINLSGKLDPELSQVISDIKKLDDGLPDLEGATNVDQLRALRERLFDLKTVAPGEIKRRPHFQSGRLYNALTNTLENPQSVPSNDFAKLWKKANTQARDRFNTLGKLTIAQAARSETPAQLAVRLGNPNEIDNLKVLRRTIPTKRFNEFQEAVKTNLLTDADNLTAKLKTFDGPTLDMLMTKGEQAQFRQIGKGIDKINKLGIQNALDQQSKAGALVNDLFVRNDTASIDVLFKLIRKLGGRESSLGRQIRAGLVDNISDQVIVKEKGKHFVNGKKLSAIINDYNKKGLLKFLNKQDVRNLADLEKVVPFLKAKVDTGTSLQAAEAAAGGREAVADVITGQSLSGAALQTVLEHAGIGKIFTSRVGQWLLRGTGRTPKTNRNVLSRLGGSLSLMASDIDDYKPEDLQSILDVTGQ